MARAGCGRELKLRYVVMFTPVVIGPIRVLRAPGETWIGDGSAAPRLRGQPVAKVDRGRRGIDLAAAANVDSGDRAIGMHVRADLDPEVARPVGRAGAIDD